MATKSKKQRTSTPSDSIASRIKPVSEVEDFYRCLFYGRSGTGKTTIAGTFPTPHLILDVRDKGTKSIKKISGIDVLQVESWSDFEEAYWYLYNNPELYKTVTIDTVTQLQELCMQKVKKSTEVSNTSQRAWGEVGELMKAWIIRFRDLPLHVNFIAQPRVDGANEDGEGELTPEVGAGVSPATQKILHAAVDIIGYTFIRETEKKIKSKTTGKTKTVEVNEYCLRVGPHAILTTKFRRDKNTSGDIPEVIPNATFDKLQEITEGE